MTRSVATLALALAASGCFVDYPELTDQGPSGANEVGNGEGGAATDPNNEGAGETNPNDCPPDDDLCLPVPTDGFQLQTVGGMINPGEDVETCEVVQLPGDPSQKYYVKRFEVAMTQMSHHLIIAGAVPGSATESNMQVGDKTGCITPSVYGEELVPVTGSQHKYHAEEFPDGVGRVYSGGQKLVFDYHYFNTSTEPIQARAAVNFHTVDASKVTNIAESFGMYNLAISIPPGSTNSFTKSCSFSHDVMIYKLTRHTHQWGTEFDVVVDGGPNNGEHLWTSPDYETTDHVLPEPLLMPAGTGFTFTCHFNNTSSHNLQFGTSASDEMCILFGTWYRVNANDAVPEQGCFGF